MSKSFKVIASLAILFCVLYFSYKSNEAYKAIRETGDYDTYMVRSLIGSDVICYFKINGKQLRKRVSKPHVDIRVGETFKVYYLEEIPDKYYISFEEPVISSADFAETKTKRIFNNLGILKFSYVVDGYLYTRHQIAPEEPEVDGKQSYRVMYSKTNPLLAYVMF